MWTKSKFAYLNVIQLKFFFLLHWYRSKCITKANTITVFVAEQFMLPFKTLIIVGD